MNKQKIKSELPTITDDFALWFIGTSLCTVKHEIYGKHQLTKHQFKYSSGSYKNKLYNNIINAIYNEIKIGENILRKKLGILKPIN